MKSVLIFVLLAAGCLGTVGCAAKAARSSVTAPATPQPEPAVHAPTADEPISVAQTNVVLPKPQPIQAEALATPPPEEPPTPEPANHTSKPRVPAAVKPEPRQQAGAQTAQGPPPPPPANPTASRPRIRPVESAAEQQRMLTEIGARQRQVQDILAKAKARQLSDAEKSAADRIQAFLDQTEAALKDKDLQQAEALSNRALLLCPELNPGK